MTTALSPKLLEKVLPRRSIAGSAGPATPASAKRVLARVAKTYTFRPWFAGAFEAGLGAKPDAKLKPARTAAHALLSAPTLEAIGQADVTTLAVAETMIGWCRAQRRDDGDHSLVSAIVVARSLDDAIDVKVATLGFVVDGEGNCRFVRVDHEPGGREWPALRHVVCAADATTYAAAVKRAAAHHKKLGLEARMPLAWAFPDEPWADEDLLAAAADAKKFPNPHAFLFLLGACSTPRAVDAVIAARSPQFIPSHALDLVQSLPEKDALRILREALEWSFEHWKSDKTPKHRLVEAMTCLRSKEAADALAPYLGDKIVGPIVAAYFQDAPELRDAIAPAAKKTGKLAAVVARVSATGTKPSATGPIAVDAAVPGVLRERPWRPRQRAAAVVLSLKVPEGAPERLDMPRATAAELEATLRNPWAPRKIITTRDPTPKELARWRRDLGNREKWPAADYWFVGTTTPVKGHFVRVPAEEGLREWNAGRVWRRLKPEQFLALHGVAALSGFLVEDLMKDLGTETGDRLIAALAHVVSPRLAPLFARLLARRKEYRRDARAWLVRNADTAALALIPDALGPASEARDDAEQALELLSRKGQRDVVRRVARGYGVEALTAIDALLDRDPLALDTNATKAPDFLRLGDLPAVTLKGGAHLGEEARDALLEMLRVAPVDPPYAGVLAVRDACDTIGLGAFARELCEQWLLAGAPGRHEWMLFSVIAFPSEEGTRRVATLAREWARKDAAKAERACVALVAIGTDAALMHVAHIADTTRYEALRKEARSILEEAAAERGLTRDELEDRAVPDLDLGAAGTMTLSYGPRSFVVTLDEAMRPVVREASVVLPGLPRPTKTDDAVLAKAARARYDALVADAAAVAKRQVHRFERAMTERRTWSQPDFVTYVTRQPLLARLARSIVWEAVPQRGPSFTFRVAEDATFADVRDRAVAVPDDARVRIAHPAMLEGTLLADWRKVFSEHELLQPFEQLGRVVYAVTDAERKVTSLTRQAGVSAATTRLLGVLEGRGWRRDDTSLVGAYLRTASGTGAERFDVKLQLSPGIFLENVASTPTQTLGEVQVHRVGSSDPATLGALHPVDFSEIVRDVVAVAGNA